MGTQTCKHRNTINARFRRARSGRPQWSPVLCILSVLLMPDAIIADASPAAMQWLVMHFPPIYIRGDSGATGWGDETIRLLNNAIPDASISYREINIARGMREMHASPDLCSASLYKSAEREAFITFSEPVYWLYSNHALVNQGARDLIAPFLIDGALDLQQLIEKAPARLAVINERSYGPSLDQQLARIAFGPGQRTDVAGGNTELLMRMLWAGRVDLVLGNPVEHYYFSQLYDLDMDKVLVLPLHGEAPYTLGYIGCSKSPQGDALVAAFNPWILKHRQETIPGFIARWLPESMRAGYLQATRDFFRNLPESTEK